MGSNSGYSSNLGLKGRRGEERRGEERRGEEVGEQVGRESESKHGEGRRQRRKPRWKIKIYWWNSSLLFLSSSFSRKYITLNKSVHSSSNKDLTQQGWCVCPHWFCVTSFECFFDLNLAFGLHWICLIKNLHGNSCVKGPTSTGQRPGLCKTMLSLEETRELCHVTQKNTCWDRKTRRTGELGVRDVEYTDRGKVRQTKTIND